VLGRVDAVQRTMPNCGAAPTHIQGIRIARQLGKSRGSVQSATRPS
jgi:hypothetical protein